MSDISAIMGETALDGTVADAANVLRDISHLAGECDHIAGEFPLPDDPDERRAILGRINLLCAMQRAIVALADGAERELDGIETRLIALRRPEDRERSAHCGGGHDCGAPALPAGETRPEA